MTPASRRDFLQRAGTAVVAVVLGLTTTAARQAGITVLSGNGARVAVAELARQFEQKTGRTVTVTFAVNPEVQSRIEAGSCQAHAPPIADARVPIPRISPSPSVLKSDTDRG